MTAAPAGDEADAAAALVAAVRGLGRASVLVVGDAMLDRYMFGEVERVSPEAPVSVLLVERELSLPGGAGNVVRNLGALGAAVAFVSIVGDDQSGSDLTGLIGGQPGVEPWLLVQGGRRRPPRRAWSRRGSNCCASIAKTPRRCTKSLPSGCCASRATRWPRPRSPSFPTTARDCWPAACRRR